MKRLLLIIILIIPFIMSGCTKSEKMNTELFRDRICTLTQAVRKSDSLTVEGDSLDFSLSMADGTKVYFRCIENLESGELERVQIVFDKENIRPETIRTITKNMITLLAPGAEYEKLTKRLIPKDIGKTDFDIIRESDAFAGYSAIISEEGIGITCEKK